MNFIELEDLEFIESDTVYISNNTDKEIYHEAMESGIWVSVDLNPQHHHNTVVKLSEPRPSDMAEQIVKSNITGRQSLFINLRDGKERNSVQVALRRVMKRDKKRLTIRSNTNNFGITVEKRTDSNDYRYQLSCIDSQGMFIIHESDRYLVSAKTQIYRIARELNINVSISDRTVTLRKANASTKLGHLREFVGSIPFDQPVKYYGEHPDLRVALNKLPYECSYRNGMITKHTYRLCNRAKGVEVRTTSKTLTRIENLSISGINENHRNAMNDELYPHGIHV